MSYEVSQRFYFEAAHTLDRQVDAAGSRRIHGHTYLAEVTVAGQPDPATGMVVDLGLLRRHIQAVRDVLDHAMLDDVPDLGPATLENLCAYIARGLRDVRPSVAAVRISREASGDSCLLRIDSTETM